MSGELVVGVLLGLVQGVFEWLPISSEGNVAIALRALGRSADDAVGYALFLHVGTAVSATAYYRDEFADVLDGVTGWRPATAFGEHATASYIALAMAVSGVVGIAAYTGLKAVVSELAGGAFVALVGVLLILTGLLQRYANADVEAAKAQPDAVDAVFVGAMQGLAILPGVSRSGTTASALLFRGHDGESAFRLSFLLSVPAALAAGALEVYQSGGIPGVDPTATLAALVVAAVVGYATIDALMRVVERVSFWLVCVGLGSLAVVGGLMVLAVT
ncbi:undecaprenyl-diphosphate phosphatase [Halorubellus sp. JP-L1]|uniref:undecaprenyl-diphosphate phosphatase n=1 Tax=Halorubellus sp. JP-L1 TaxID=2715753 RepID=UPI00140AFDFD|nr:undecaprenyl-diphosphate phosphatase [Halorubellus sp. JP-L1]NHN40974.1 undecaprenyl-diphosphate phosphatase [Halorubellus sp. JP-L1]